MNRGGIPMQRRLASQNITEGVIWKQLLFFFFPILLGTFFQQMYNTVDTIVVGRFVGTQALAAVGATAPMISLLNGFFIGLSSGATVLISQFCGANDRSGIRKALHTGVGLALVLGVIITVLGLSAGPWILRTAKTPESCLGDSVLYTRVYFSGAVASMVYNMGSGILRAMGDSRRPTLFLIVTCFVNVVLDILFVVILRMGVMGAALATILSQLVSALLVVAVLARLPEDICLRTKAIGLDGRLIRRILVIGVPAGLQFVTFDLANLLIQSGVNSFGSNMVAAFIAYSKADALTWMVSGAFGVSITTFVGQNFGAQKYDRIRKSVWICLGMSFALIGSLSAIIVIFRQWILGIITVDAEVIRLGAYVMIWTVPFNCILTPMEIFGGAMRGTGNALLPTSITSVCICLFRVIWLATLVRRFHQVEMLLVVYPISWVLTSVVITVIYLRGNWLRKRILACGLNPME